MWQPHSAPPFHPPLNFPQVWQDLESSTTIQLIPCVSVWESGPANHRCGGGRQQSSPPGEIFCFYIRIPAASTTSPLRSPAIANSCARARANATPEPEHGEAVEAAPTPAPARLMLALQVPAHLQSKLRWGCLHANNCGCPGRCKSPCPTMTSQFRCSLATAAQTCAYHPPHPPGGSARRDGGQHSDKLFEAGMPGGRLVRWPAAPAKSKRKSVAGEVCARCDTWGFT